MQIKKELIAPCGMNCTLCISYQAMANELNKKGFHKKYCAGCRLSSNICSLKAHCPRLYQGRLQYCHECPDFPCKWLKNLDKRYRTKYHMSMIENLKSIKEKGMAKFLEEEIKTWRCPECGGIVCCHNGLCLHCDLEKLKRNKKYRWGEE